MYSNEKEGKRGKVLRNLHSSKIRKYRGMKHHSFHYHQQNLQHNHNPVQDTTWSRLQAEKNEKIRYSYQNIKKKMTHTQD